jgi:KaiC/GvpD/RAD55 family RecA-like ATPase
MTNRFLNQRIEKLRIKLLDLTRSNPLISVRLSARSNACVRIIDEIPASVYAGLVDQQKFAFVALPELDETPRDENSPEFLKAIASARATDAAYIDAISKVDEESDGGDQALKTIERALKDRVRLALGMPRRLTRGALSLEEHAKAHAIDPSFDLKPNANGLSRHSDKRLQTLLLPDDLLRKLNALVEKDKTWADETGISVLKACFGLLEWSDPATEEITRSPLVLVPVKLEKYKTDKGSKFSLTAVGEDARVNPVLVEKLSRDYGITLPDFDADSDLENFFKAVSRLSPERLSFTCRRQILVGVFPSAREAMFVDSDTTQTEFTESEIITDLFLGSEAATGAPLFADDYANDEPSVERHVPYLVLDADPSQFSALVDVAKGTNLPIEGPPGTGKSQTIVNIIANAIATGKKVLFIAEKTTALEVVRARLKEVGLSEFALPFQVTRNGRAAVIESIRDRIEFKPVINSEYAYERSIGYFRSVREELTTYLRVLAAPVGSTGLSVYEVLSNNIKNRKITQKYSYIFSRLTLNLVESIDRERLQQLKEKAANLSAAHDQVRQSLIGWHPISRSLSTIEIDSHIGACRAAASDLELLFDALKALGYQGVRTPDITRLKRVQSAILSASRGVEHIDVPWLMQVSAKSDTHFLICRYKKFAIGLSRKCQIEQQLQRGITSADETQLSELIRLCERLSIDKISKSEIDSIRSLDAELCAAVKKRVDSWREFFGLVDILVNTPIGRVSALAQAAISAPPEALRLLEAVPLSVGAAQLSKLAHKGLVLKARLATLATEAGRDPIEKAVEAKKLLRIFQNTGWVGRLSSEYRNAKDAFIRDFGKSFFEKADAERIITAFLSEVAAWESARDDFINDPQFKEIFGVYANGLSTPFDSFVDLGTYLEKLEMLFREPKEVILRSKLRRPDALQLEALRGLPRELLTASVADVECFADLELRHQQLDEGGRLAEEDIETILDIKRKFRVIESCQQARRLRKKIRQVLIWEKIFFSADGELQREVVLPKKLNLSSTELVESLFVNTSVARRLASLAEDADWALRLLSGPSIEIASARIDSAIAANERVQRYSSDLSASTGLISSVAALGSLGDRIRKFRDAADDRDGLISASMYAELSREMQQFGSGIFETWERDIPHGDLSFAEFFEAVYYYCLAQKCFERYGERLTSYNGERLDAVRKKIREADLEYISAARARIAYLVDKNKKVPAGVGRGPKSEYSEYSLIKNEVAKTKRWVSLRSLVSRAGSALLELKPCWMMSPLAVAQYLPKGMIFDICIIDEASQMPPEEAIGALSRCRQAVIVGDTNQLPPTSFFKRLFSDDESSEDELVSEESILEMANAVFSPRRRLQHHYRSRHSSLIQFSNQQIYDGSLVIYPDADVRRDDFGVSLKFVEGLYKAGVNRLEAECVVDAIVEFMREQPHRSLGVVLLNQKQTQLVLEGYHRAYEQYSWVSEYVERWDSEEGKREPFFIRNLENVQGDERDVIFIGTVYGRERPESAVMQRFGPINGPAGRRRLNVLFTRAKEQIVTFTSMRPSDIVADEAGNPGANLLKQWLEYSKTGMMVHGASTGREPDSEFEEHVISQIEAMGFLAVPQVGVSGYFIDIGVKHPGQPDRYLVGVECDGASFHSSTSARNRDRIRETVLQGLGWRLHRIWSTDWFKNAPREIEKLRQVLLARLAEASAQNESGRGVVKQAGSKSANRGGFTEIPQEDNRRQTVELDDGATYIGPMKDGLFHGVGTYIFPSGDQYEGEFAQGVFQGRGKYSYANGDCYTGEFENDLFHGRGKLTFSSGQTQEGEFNQGKAINVICRDPDGTEWQEIADDYE